MAEAGSPENVWPPKSPRDLLLNTPSGRRRLQCHRDQLSPTPSPAKRRTQHFNQNELALDGSADDDQDDSEEDEETLQLKLAAIQAKLKLKKLQKAKAGTNSAASSIRSSHDPVATAKRILFGSQTSSTTQDRHLSQTSANPLRSTDTNADQSQVPASPKQRRIIADPASPSRVLLGIDKGRKAKEVSLRRPPQSTFRPGPRIGAFGPSQNRGVNDIPLNVQKTSFSERIARLKTDERATKERAARIFTTRSKTFGLNEKEISQYQEAAGTLSQPKHGRSQPLESKTFSREDVLSTGITGSNSSTNSIGTTRSSELASFEPYSAIHLSKRIIPHTALTRTLTGKKIFTLPDVLKVIKSPHYEPPDIEEDWVVFGIVASKSTPYDHKENDADKAKAGPARQKFMVLHLTNLKWELDLFLFGEGFTKFWKLTPGTLIAILNPNVMPPPPAKKDAGKFSLSLTSTEDTVLEIGSARDLGFCKSMKRDGKQCTQWVDLRHTEFCEFHINLNLQKTRAGRMEVNTMSSIVGSDGSRGAFGEKRDWKSRRPKPPSNAPFADRPERFGGAGGFIHISDTRLNGRTAASLLDDDDIDPDGFHRGSTKNERLQRRLGMQEKEAIIRKKLAAFGSGGMGAEYLRQTRKDGKPQPAGQRSPTRSEVVVPTISGGGAADVRLSPLRRKRPFPSSHPAPPPATSRSPTRTTLSDASGPARKKTRFVTEKGIREAGRESFVTLGVDNHDDDGLDIVS